MARSLPDSARSGGPIERVPGAWLPFIPAVGLGLGAGLIASGGTPLGAGVMAASAAVLLGGHAALRLVRKRSQPAIEETGPAAPEYIDPETGLPNALQFDGLLKREIARSQRYGDRMALAVFDVAVSGYQLDEGGTSPSPAPYVAAELRKAARDADVLGRLSEARFAVLLTECGDDGARLFCDRTRTRLGTSSFGRNAEGKALYVRAWAGAANWDSQFTTPQWYIDAAIADMDRSRPAYESEQAWFRGQPEDPADAAI